MGCGFASGKDGRKEIVGYGEQEYSKDGGGWLFSAILLMTLVFGLLPSSAAAETNTADANATGADSTDASLNIESAPRDVEASFGEIVNIRTSKVYTDLALAAAEAQSGDRLKLGEGNYTLYKVASEGHTKGKDLTFEGSGTDKTSWNIGAEVPDPTYFGTEYNGDYSFDGAGSVTFKNMTLRSGSANYLGFIRADKTVVDGCVVNGKTFYWGYQSATFTDTTFNAPNGDYAIWTYSSPIMTFNGCTFNASGKVINVYTDAGAGKNNITVNVSNCTFNSKAFLGLYKQALNINDSNMGDYKYVINFTGNNTVTAERDKATCTQLFGFGGKSGNNTGRSDVSIDGKLVYSGGKMLSHDYTDGEHEDNFVDQNDYVWEQKADGWYCTGHAKCGYCDWPLEETVKAELTTETSCTENGKAIYTANFQHKCFAPQTRSDDLDPLGHDWALPVYTWAKQGDDWYCTAERVCNRDASHIEKETVKASYKVAVPATAEKEGEGTYTAVFENQAFETQVKTEPIAKLPATPSDSGNPSGPADSDNPSKSPDTAQSQLDKTGDATLVVLPAVAAIAAGSALCIGFAARRRKSC